MTRPGRACTVSHPFTHGRRRYAPAVTTESGQQFREARIVIEVVAGLIPGRDPDPQYTRRYVVYSDDWAKAKEDETGLALGRLLAESNGQAIGYAEYLMMQPARVNWVRTEWIYL